MKKINFSNKKAVKALVVVVAMCILVGTLITNSLRLLSIAQYSNRVAVSQSQQSQKSPSKGNNSSQSNANSNVEPAPVDPVVPETQAPAGETTTEAAGGVTSGAVPETQAPTTETPAKPAPTEKTTKQEIPTEAPTEVQTTKPTTTEPSTDSAAVKKEKKNILKKYISVVNSANTVKAGFTKSRYRACNNKSALAYVSLFRLERTYPDYFISESNPKITTVAFGGERTEFCIPNKSYACLASYEKASDILLDAKERKNDDGTVTLTLVLRDEVNPKVSKPSAKKPASNTSAFFDIIGTDDIGAMIKGSNITGSYDKLDVTYSGCTIELTYTPATGRISSLTQTVKYTASASKNLATIELPTSFGVTDVSTYSDFVYTIL